MPLIDMPREELLKYQGISPCPSDIDEFWDKMLKKTDEHDPEPQFVKASYQFPAAECYDLYFKGLGGDKIHCKVLKPRNLKGEAPCLLEFHGYSGSSSDWSHYIAHVSSGFVVFALDCRGQGGLSEDLGGVRGTTRNGQIIRGLDGDGPEDLYFAKVFCDTVLMAKIAASMDYVDENNMGACGGSQGGALTVACAALYPNIKYAAFNYPFLSDYKRVWEMDLCKDAYLELKEYFRRHDPYHEREDEIFYRLGYIDIQNIAKRIKASCYMQTGLMDTICPPSTQFAAYNKITAPKKVIFAPDFGHEGVPYISDKFLEFFIEQAGISVE